MSFYSDHSSVFDIFTGEFSQRITFWMKKLVPFYSFFPNDVFSLVFKNSIIFSACCSVNIEMLGSSAAYFSTDQSGTQLVQFRLSYPLYVLVFGKSIAARLAQLVEHQSYELVVASSILAVSKQKSYFWFSTVLRDQQISYKVVALLYTSKIRSFYHY